MLGGYVEVDEILKHQPFYKSLHASREDIYRVVETNDKRRFQIDTDSSGVEMIKATQGHTVVVRFESCNCTVILSDLYILSQPLRRALELAITKHLAPVSLITSF